MIKTTGKEKENGMHAIHYRLLRILRTENRRKAAYNSIMFGCYNCINREINEKLTGGRKSVGKNRGRTLLPPVFQKDSRHSPLLWLLDEVGGLRKAVGARARRNVGWYAPEVSKKEDGDGV